MSDYITLMGSEQVQSAGNAMRNAAEEMQRAASSIADSMFRLQQLTQEWTGIAQTIAEAAAAMDGASRRGR